MLLGERIRQARLLKKLTQKQLAELLNVTDATINRYEKGLRSPDPEMLKAIADILDVSVDYLLGHTDIKNPAEKITKALEDDPELLEFWEDISSREDLKIMFKQAKDLSPQDIKTIIALIRRFKNEQAATQL
ncbi:transcriptional regulator [Thermoanaerobacterium sp. PSU-2]|uniref:helix-turn-helix domain-containing protein n=1 Tax=Thermoanaerobacterium sp. PSU-2 TaxID=1930849 RepID=UPI000A14766A|nr:helix-turn-helix transcriptional regulator [Thermoanaerobacterium sp. PSU-2]ORX22743.1 transcriptional regulator [Thermoanaerobacterium sp. PSU-2]